MLSPRVLGSRCSSIQFVPANLVPDAVTNSTDLTNPESADSFKIAAVACKETQLVLNRCGSDQCVRQPYPFLPPQPASTLCHHSPNIQLAKGSEKDTHNLRCSIASKQLGPRHNRIVHAVRPRIELPRSAQMINEHIRVD